MPFSKSYPVPKRLKDKKSLFLYRISVLLITGVVILYGCSKKENNYFFYSPPEETVKDADGNVYQSVFIKGQTWMVQNLRTTRYNDGTPIPDITDAIQWGQLKTAGYCNYENDTGLAATYGRLYNWYAVTRGNLCPYQFHVPYDHDWQHLIDTAGGQSYAGFVLKEKGTAHWQDNPGSTDQFGFRALPGGMRSAAGMFEGMGLHGCWWGNTYSLDQVLVRTANNDNNSVNRTETDKNAGYSVRCVRDF
jgi:uncharacterized protein (TIGR02145 family)